MIHTHVVIQKPYLYWIRNPCTLKFFHVFINLHHIAHNIKSDTVQGDTLQVLLAIIAYEHMRIEEIRQEHHQLQTSIFDNHTLLKLTVLITANSLYMGQWIRQWSTEYI